MKLVAELKINGFNVYPFNKMWRTRLEAQPVVSIVENTVLVNNFTTTELNEMVDKGSYHKFFVHKRHELDCSLLFIAEPTKLLSFLTYEPKSLIKKALRDLELEVEPALTSEKKPKFADIDHPNVRHLRNILSQCPKVTVEVAETLKPKELQRKVAKVFKGELAKDNPNVPYLCTALFRFAEAYKLLKLDKLNTCLTEEYCYPETLEQYAALALMQSYGTPFRSCQYVPVHELSFKSVEAFLKGNQDDEFVELTDTEAYAAFSLGQTDDFEEGVCDRFFKLTPENTVEKRFSLYHDGDGDYVFSNFYRSPRRRAYKIGNVLMTNTVERDDLQPTTYSYFNREDTVDTALELLEQLLESMG